MLETSPNAAVRHTAESERNFMHGGRTLLGRCGSAFATACLGFLLAFPNPGWGQEPPPPDDYESFYEVIQTAASFVGLNYNLTVEDAADRITLSASDIEKKAIAAYFWGITLVEMRRTQQLILWQYDLEANDLYTPQGINEGDSVVNPNLDVLYVQGFIDFEDPSLSEAALVLTIPDTDPEDTGRGVFNVMQILDAYTQVVGSYGTRGSPDEIDRGEDVEICLLPEGIPTNKGADVLLSGPGYEAGVPVELQGAIVAECKISTNQVWLIGRVAVDGQTQTEKSGSDYLKMRADANSDFLNELSIENVRENFSYEYALTPLQDYVKTPENPDEYFHTPTEKDLEGDSREIDDFDPNNPLNHDFFNQDIENPNVAASAVEEHPDAAPFWSSQDFFQYLGESIVQNGVPEGDETLLAGFEEIGLSAENGYEAPAELTKTEMNAALVKAANFLGWIKDGNLPAPKFPEGGNWNTSTDVGLYDRTSQGWFTAAVVAAVGLGANLGEDGVYPLMNGVWEVPESGLGNRKKSTPLNGANNYELILDPDNDFVDPENFVESGIPPVMLDSNAEFPLGYWGITVYDSDFRIVQYPATNTNPFYGGNVYSLGSTQLEVLRRENPVTSSVTFYLQHSPPADPEKLPYWLPVPEDDFKVVLRVYAPDMNHFPIPYEDGPGSGDEQVKQGQVWPGLDFMDDDFTTYAPPNLVPEPASTGIFAIGVLGILAAYRRTHGVAAGR